MELSGYFELSTELKQSITAEQAWHYMIVPKEIQKSRLTFYIDDNKNSSEVQEELEMIFGKKISLEKAAYEKIENTLSRFYRQQKKRSIAESVDLSQKKSDNFLENIIKEADEIGSSDIHIETYEDACRIRLRIDGKLIERYIIGKPEYPALINKIKIKSNLDIAEKRLPQDGRIFFKTSGKSFDIRVSVLPTLYGEKVVMRLLSKDAAQIDIKQLGFSEQQLNIYLDNLKKTQGIILISGPTGSGKTTTLYATLKILNNNDRNIVTIEDPIEYTLDGINQVQLKESIGLTFASALRTFLRQDPDIIMLGEIRDGETAQMAIRAALTGHLVLSTIHTNSAWGTITRLIDMGVPPFLLSSTLNLSIAQRLLRKLCENCKEETNEMKTIHFHTGQEIKIATHFHAKGCSECFYTGYKGRIGIYEIIPISNEFAINIEKDESEISGLLQQNNIKSLKDQAIQLVKTGVTSFDEAYPVLIQ